MVSWGHWHGRKLGRRRDFGANLSLREHLALGQKLHYYAFVDVLGHMSRLQHLLVRAFAEYLTQRGIDIQDLVRSTATIINNNQQNIFHNLTTGAMTFGDGSTATGTVNQNRDGQAGGAAPPPRQA